jgi:hypothetical protein
MSDRFSRYEVAPAGEQMSRRLHRSVAWAPSRRPLKIRQSYRVRETPIFKAVFLRRQKSDLRHSGGLFISVRFVFYHTRKLIHANRDNLEGDQVDEPVFSSIDTSVSHLWPRAPYPDPDPDPMGRWRSKDGPGGKWTRWPRRRIRRP